MAATAKPKVIKVPGAKAPKFSAKLPSVPKAPMMGTASANMAPYAAASKAIVPKLPKGV